MAPASFRNSPAVVPSWFRSCSAVRFRTLFDSSELVPLVFRPFSYRLENTWVEKFDSSELVPLVFRAGLPGKAELPGPYRARSSDPATARGVLR